MSEREVTKTKSGRDILYFVIREGKVPGVGRYFSTYGCFTNKPNSSIYRSHSSDAFARRLTRSYARKHGGRVVAIVRVR